MLNPGKLSIEDVTLLEDHACTKQTLPCVTIQTLTDHTDEVWYCKFSPDGTKLATGSKDGNLCVYDLDMVISKISFSFFSKKFRVVYFY